MAEEKHIKLAATNREIKPLISVVIPIYKVEDYLARCVDSVISQTYSNMEIILVNDGSPDGCASICDAYAENDKRIIVVHKENGGLSDARNVGIESSNGEFIAFIDSDDWIHKSYLNTLYEILATTEADISACNFKKVTQLVGNEEITSSVVHEYTNIEALGQFFDGYYTQMVVAWGKLYKIVLFENVRFPIGKILEDEFTTYKLIYSSKKISLTTASLYYYYQRDDSIIGEGFRMEKRLAMLEAYGQRADFFKEVGLDDLASKTYRQLFLKGFYIEQWLRKFSQDSVALEFGNDFLELRNKLRQGKYKFKFRLFYEFYYLSPKVTCWIHNVLMRIRKISLTWN